MDQKRERALRVVASLEQRTVENGCTPAEALQAKQKAAEIRERFGIAASEPLPGGPDVLDVPLFSDAQFVDAVFAAIIMEAEARAFGVKAKTRSRTKRRPGSPRSFRDAMRNFLRR